MKRISKVLLLCFIAALPLTMAPSGGFPSRPTFQEATIRATVPLFKLHETAAAANNRSWRLAVAGEQMVLDVCNDDFVSCAGGRIATIDRTGQTVDSLNLAATTVTVNGSSVAVNLSGSGSLSLSSICSSGTSTSYSYERSGNIVTLTVGANSCTQGSAGVLTFGSAISAAGRPSVDRFIPAAQALDNGAAKNIGVRVQTNGNVTIYVVAGTGLTNFSGTGTLAWSTYSYTYAL